MSSRFAYLAETIRSAPFSQTPFRHVYVEGLLSADDFAAIVGAPEIGLPPAGSDAELFSTLYAHGYRIIDFPGCITSEQTYRRWHRRKGAIGRLNNSACEGFGVTLRLVEPRTPILQELTRFLGSDDFNRALAEKFGVPFEETSSDHGLQKYLDGYEISPHPDVRRKALTYMVNINSHPGSETLRHHTQYLRLKPEYGYVQAYWQGRPDVDRCWIPWDWCTVEQEQTRNNSIVIFQPADDTLHGVKADYDHLPGQRTQLYGNLWYASLPRPLKHLRWEDLVVATHDSPRGRARPFGVRMPPALRTILDRFRGGSTRVASRHTPRRELDR